MQRIHIVSWNVNGVRAIVKKDFKRDIDLLNPDILCLQETKAQPEDAKKALQSFSNYNVVVNSSKLKKGYSGTAILSKVKPIHVSYDMGIEQHDQEGRVITSEYDHFYLIVVYAPNAGEGMKRLDYRVTWDVAFTNYVNELDKKKPVVICGDLNVAHTAIDLARHKENYNKNSGHTQKEIDGFENLLSSGYLDTFRLKYPDTVKYTWWNYKFRARDRNVGWRIDYFLVSERLKEQVKDALIYNDYFGSDHCPVGLYVDV